MSDGWTREQMAARAAQDIPDGSYVNLGIGIPELVARFVPEGRVFTYHTENLKNAVLAPLMDRLLPQAYSVRHRSNKTIGWNDSLGPGKHQSLAIARARQAAAA